MNRKHFINTLVAAGAVSAVDVRAGGRTPKQELKIALAQGSVRALHRAKPGQKGYLDPSDFAAYAQTFCGIQAVEYVNTFYADKAGDETYFSELRKRADDLGVKSLLMMCNECGMVGDPGEAARQKMVERHEPWMQAAAQLGCHSISVSAQSMGGFEDQQKFASDGLAKLAEAAATYGLNVLVENQGGFSNNGEWMAGLMKKINLPTVGTLPDIGNVPTQTNSEEEFDRYKNFAQMMPYAKVTNATSHEFDVEGNEVRTDYYKMMQIVAASGFSGYMGIKWEGKVPATTEGILKTKALIERAIKAL